MEVTGGTPIFFLAGFGWFPWENPKKKWMRTGGSPILRIETLICQIMSIRKVPIDKNWIWKKHQGIFWFFSMALPTLNQKPKWQILIINSFSEAMRLGFERIKHWSSTASTGNFVQVRLVAAKIQKRNMEEKPARAFRWSSDLKDGT